MSTLILSTHISHLAAEPVLVGYSVAVVGELIDRLRVLEAPVAAQDGGLADLRHQLGEHSCNSGRLAPETRLTLLPPLAVTEHRAHAVSCPGSRTGTRVAFPTNVSGSVQFGHRLGALAAYLPTAQPRTLCQRAAALLEPEITGQRTRALAVPVTRMNETDHGLCNVHLLGNLQEIVELEKEPDGWAARMQRRLLEARIFAVHWCEAAAGPLAHGWRHLTFDTVAEQLRRIDQLQKLKLKREPDLTLKHKAFAYQLEAVNAVKDLEYAAIFHEQGLGKTKVAIDLIIYWLLHQLLDTVLIVAKKGLIHNWQRELASHSQLVPRVLTNNRGGNFYVFNSPARIILAHYEAVKTEWERMRLFLQTRSVGVILDESTKIKNPDAALTRTFLDLAPLFTKRVIMSGTPVSNRPHDIWSQIKFLDGGTSLGNDFGQFKHGVNLSNDLGGVESRQKELEIQLQHIFQSISEFTVRETKASAKITLPEKIVHCVATEWEPRQRELYRQVRESLRAIIFQDGQLIADESDVVLKRLLRLVQVTSNPNLIDTSYQVDPGKLEILLELISSIAKDGEKCLVWTSFVENVEWLARVLRRYNPQLVHGMLSTREQTDAIHTFLNDSSAKIFIATPGSAKEGLTLTVANHVIFYDRLFSLDDYLQAQDRIHRISQDRVCHVYNLIMRDSIDEWVEALLHSKQIAAQLAQGDIDMKTFHKKMSYEFGDILQAILDT